MCFLLCAVGCCTAALRCLEGRSTLGPCCVLFWGCRQSPTVYCERYCAACLLTQPPVVLSLRSVDAKPFSIRSLWVEMEPVGWVIDKVGSRHEGSATGNDLREQGSTQSSPGGSGLNVVGSIAPRSPPGRSRDTDDACDGSSLRREPAHSSSVDDLLRRIARDVNARQARADSRREGDVNYKMRDDSRRSRSDADQPNIEGQKRKISPVSTRRSRWSTLPEQHDQSREERGTPTQMGGGGRGGEEGQASATVAVSTAEANPFTESMWEDVSCRQVLQAMFFAPDSAVPAGSTEEYKELEGEGSKDGIHHTPYARLKAAIVLLWQIR